jgi:hypothetical protein
VASQLAGADSNSLASRARCHFTPAAQSCQCICATSPSTYPPTRLLLLLHAGKPAMFRSRLVKKDNVSSQRQQQHDDDEELEAFLARDML